jgi:VanZ family protein
MTIRTALCWLVTVAWAAEIFYLSTPTFGEDFSVSLLAQILNTFHLGVPPETLDVLDSVLRKLAHLAEYAILSLLLYGAFAGRDGFRWQPPLAYWSLVVAVVYSLTDELHQILSPGRHASLIDCGIDSIGAAIAMLLVYGGSRLSEAKSGPLHTRTLH